MSFVATAWALRQNTGSGSRKAVLMALADRHNGDTGKCCPSEKRIAAEWELSERTVRRALDDLVEQGLASRSRRRRPDGTLGVYSYTLHMDTVSPPAATVAASPPDTVAGQELEVDPEQATTSSEVVVHRPIVTRRGWKVDRRPVTDDEETMARAVLDYWNRATGQGLSAQGWLAKIVMRQREHPEATLADHARVIDAALAAPWWRGAPTPSVVYGSDSQFERSIESARVGDDVALRQAVERGLEAARQKEARA